MFPYLNKREAKRHVLPELSVRMNSYIEVSYVVKPSQAGDVRSQEKYSKQLQITFVSMSAFQRKKKGSSP